VDGKRFEYELNLLLKSKESGISIKQVPIATIYDNNNKGTHFRTINDSVRVIMPLLKFCGSSITSGILDFILLFLFQWLTGSLFWGVVLARVVSSIFNYSVNKKLVFSAKNISHTRSAPGYFSLVIVIMLLNYCLIAFMTKIIGIPDVPAKLLTEITLFTMSYTVQKFFIFRRCKEHPSQILWYNKSLE
jgi:putative flippase GtrA